MNLITVMATSASSNVHSGYYICQKKFLYVADAEQTGQFSSLHATGQKVKKCQKIVYDL